MTDTLLAFTALGIVLGAGFLWVQAIKQVSIPSNRGLYLTAILTALCCAVFAFQGSPGWIGGIAAGLALLVCVFFLLTFAISAQKLGSKAIKVGDQIPAFNATTAEGESFDSTSLAGTPVLLKFFRGHW